MTISNLPAWGAGIRTLSAVCTAAKSTYNDNTNAVKMVDGAGVSAGPNGSLLVRLSAIPRATFTDTQLQLFRSPDTSGTVMSFIKAPKATGATVNQVTATTDWDFGYSETLRLFIPIGGSLWAGAGAALAGGWVFTADVVDL
jgi:hypothetical protein